MGRTVYGYARVSSRDQNADRQIDAMKAYGVCGDHIFIDYQSGASFNRPAWKSLNGRLKHGDVLVLHSIDRLGRSYSNILDEWTRLTRSLGVKIVVLSMPIVNGLNIQGLSGQLIFDIVLRLMSYVAEMERNMIKERQREGIEAARKRGVKFGAPCKMKPEEFDAVANEWRAGRISTRAAAKSLAVSRGTFKKWVAKGVKI